MFHDTSKILILTLVKRIVDGECECGDKYGDKDKEDRLQLSFRKIIKEYFTKDMEEVRIMNIEESCRNSKTTRESVYIDNVKGDSNTTNVQCNAFHN